MFEDGAYCDGTFRPDGHSAAIGIVLVRNGEVIHIFAESVAATNSFQAECIAIYRARQMYPDEKIFNDSSSAAAKMSVNWIRREFNQHAHLAAAHGQTRHQKLMSYINDIVFKKIVKRRVRKNSKKSPRCWRGRGCIDLAHEKARG